MKARANRRLSMPRISFLGTSFINEAKKSHNRQINQYLLVDKIGSGTFSKVFLAYDTQSHTHTAVKKVRTPPQNYNITQYQDNSVNTQVQREVVYLTRFKHPNIIELKEALSSVLEQTTYLIFEYADCGSLLSHKNLKENQIKIIFKQIGEALLYLHNNGLVHHDIKPSNILLFSDGSAKLSDFGTAHSFASSDTVFGSPAYQSPEIFEMEDEFGLDPTKGDTWSLGVSMYEVFFGCLPFLGSNEFEIASSARNTKIDFPKECSNEFKDLLSSMLKVGPCERASIRDFLFHPFFDDIQPKEELKLEPRIIPKVDYGLPILTSHADNFNPEIINWELQPRSLPIAVDDFEMPQRPYSQAQFAKRY